MGVGAALVFGAVGAGVSAIGQTDWRVTITGPNGGERVYEVSADTEGEATDAAWAEFRAEFSTTAVPASGTCETTLGGDPLTASIPACAIVSQDTAQTADPEPRWGKIDCESDSRVTDVASGGDPHPTATGALQGNSAYRRLTVLDGDNISGERCELGRNEQRYGSDGGDGTFQLYREGQRRITFISFRLPDNFHLNHSRGFQNVLQMKQTQPSDNGSCPPELSLQVRDGDWVLQHQTSAGECEDSETLWKAPAEGGVWVRAALDVTYSRYRDEGRVKLYLDRNGDGDSLDDDERSPTITTHTLKYETADPDGYDTDGLAPGDSIPSHLRVGIYHDFSYDCPAPSGCSTEVDNVQVVRP